MTPEYGSLPFDKAVEFFQGKLNLPTRAWTDIWEGMHARAFVVAGATQQELLADLRAAVDKAIAKGTTLQEFRKDFAAIVKKHGWAYKGDAGWRTRVIYETNLRQAYNAGRWQQMQAGKAHRPFLLYRHGDSATPRELHLKWNGTVLPVDDPWWRTHYPQNGWGCKCKVFALKQREVERLGLKVADAAPEAGTYEWVNKRTGEVHTLPKGIDPGFAYNVGEAAWGRFLTHDVMAQWKAAKGDAWQRLVHTDYRQLGRPERLPLRPLPAALGKRLSSSAATAEALRTYLQGAEKVFQTPTLPVLVDAQSLADHIDPERAEYIPLLEDALTRPQEIWLSFEQHKGTGQMVLRARLVTVYAIGRGKGVLVVANAVRGMLEAWTFMPVRDLTYLNKQRVGHLLFAEPAETKTPP